MLKVAVVGCGKIADQHLASIQGIPGCGVTAVCDREILMAEQLADRFGVKEYFNDFDRMLKTTKPDVVHITTPAQSHYDLSKKSMEAGCHIYVEKPFTLDTAEAEDLIESATASNVKLTVGHNVQFNPEMLRMRQLVNNGYLGGPPVHMESIYCYAFANDSYAMALLGDKTHWVRSLPGKLLHNVISHGICKVAEFINSGSLQVTAHGSISPALQQIGENDIIDELRVVISDKHHTSAYFTFSSQIGPSLHQFRLFGPKRSLIVDHVHRTVIQIRPKGYKSYLNQFIPPFQYASQFAGAAFRNIAQFMTNNFHTDFGMRTLIQEFYRSIIYDTPPPIPYREILLTSRIMDEIFRQIGQPGKIA